MENLEILRLQLQGYGYRRIANMLSMSPNTVKSYVKNHSVVDYIKEGLPFCLCCGKDLVHLPKKRKKKFCSIECKRKWWNTNKAKTNNVITSQCNQCGKEYQHYKSKQKKFCSRKCYYESKKGNPFPKPKTDTETTAKLIKYPPKQE